MNFRFMRSILFFDLPMLTKSDLKEYRNFVKNIKLLGFYMLQKSVYVKMHIGPKESQSIIEKVKEKLSKDGNVCVLTITEKQFASISILLGENYTNIINSDERLIIL